jgi:hypothetical protein
LLAKNNGNLESTWKVLMAYPLALGRFRLNHRNLTYRTSMLAQVLQMFLGKDNLVNNRLTSTLDKVNYYKGTIFWQSTKLLFTSLHKIGWRSARKIIPFFKHASCSVAPKISMVLTNIAV